MTPLLSICVPTYNRAEQLRVMLQALLPQVAQNAGKVEVWISDNASPDHTAKVIEEAKRLGPLNYSRNETNIGLVSNVIKCATELARGEFVWILGDDDLLAPGALGRVLERVEANRQLHIIYLNFRYASWEKHWPNNALGGYDGPFIAVGHSDVSEHPVAHWHEVIHPEAMMGTQVYVHVIRRSIWGNYWRGRPREEDFSDTRWSFPHSVMIAETVMNEPSYYVGEPVLTVFNGAQSWWDVRQTVIFKLPGLVSAYRRNGLPVAQVRACTRMAFEQCEPLLTEVLRGEAGPRAPGIASYLRDNWRYADAWRALVHGSHLAGRPWLIIRIYYGIARLRNAFRSATTHLKRTP